MENNKEKDLKKVKQRTGRAILPPNKVMKDRKKEENKMKAREKVEESISERVVKLLETIESNEDINSNLHLKNGLILDDFTKGDEGMWTQVCDLHSKEFDYADLDDVGQGICGVKGCLKESNYYVDNLEDYEVLLRDF